VLTENQIRLAELLDRWVPDPVQQRLTTISRAAAIEIATGREVYLVAIAGEGAALPPPTGLLRPDEVFVPYTGGHAEPQTIKFAPRNGYQIKPGALEPSRAFCAECAELARSRRLAPPDAKVRVGEHIKPLADVSNRELFEAMHEEHYKRPGWRGEPTEKGLAKRVKRAAKAAAKSGGGAAEIPAPPSDVTVPPIEAPRVGVPRSTPVPAPPIEAPRVGVPRPTPVPAPEPFAEPFWMRQIPRPTPVPAPEPGFWALRGTAAKAGLKMAFSAGNIAAIAIPETILRVADVAAAREAIRTIQIKFVKEGYAKGVAAGVAGWSNRAVHSNLMNRVTEGRLRGLHDPGGLLAYSRLFEIAVAYENQAIDLGHRYSSSKTLQWREKKLADSLAELAKHGYDYPVPKPPAVKRVELGHMAYEEEPDPAESGPPRYLFTNAFIDKLAWVLGSYTDPIVEEAIVIPLLGQSRARLKKQTLK
jgi:hypothetical protein